MAQHRFQLRARFSYSGDNNGIDDIGVEISTADGWQPLELELASPGFLIFVYSFLVCQHTYFHANCGESGLKLDQSQVELLLLADDNWKIERIDVTVAAASSGGDASATIVDYIESRMRQCPVSINLKEPEDYRIKLSFDQVARI